MDDVSEPADPITKALGAAVRVSVVWTMWKALGGSKDITRNLHYALDNLSAQLAALKDGDDVE